MIYNLIFPYLGLTFKCLLAGYPIRSSLNTTDVDPTFPHGF